MLADQMAAEAALQERLNAFETPMPERLEAHGETLDLLQTIPGIDRLAAASMLAEIGPDMSVCGSARAFAAWAGVSPRNHESVGKRRRSATRKGSRHLRAAFVEAAHGAVRTRNCQFEGFCRNVAARRESKRAIVTTAHKMARIVYVLLCDRVPYRHPGTDYEALPVGRNAPRRLRQLDRFGILEPMGNSTLRVN